jgi:hypothetical protein
MTGYSNKPLFEKLGIKEDFNVLFIHTPNKYKEILGINSAYINEKEVKDLDIDFIHAFYESKQQLEKEFLNLKSRLNKSGILWISWPKGSSNVNTDLNENIVREIGLANGLVDVKVAAIDATWSGLKFVFRLKDR